MIEKIKICLFNPKRIALYSTEKIIKSIMLVLFLAIIVTIPTSIILYNQTGLDTDTREKIKDYFYTSSSEIEAAIVDGVLSATKTIVIPTGLFDIVILGDDDTLEGRSTLPVIAFEESGISISTASIAIIEFASFTYDELNVKNLNFKDMYNNDINEINSLLRVLDTMYVELKPIIAPTFTISFLIQYIMFFIINALLYALITFMVNPLVKFKMRFKICLDAQVVYAVGVLLSVLYSMVFIESIGLLVSGIYIFLALTSIVGIKIKKAGSDLNE